MEEGSGELELEKGEYLESDCKEGLIIYPATKAACFELYALHLDSLCLDQVLKSKISKVSSKDPTSFEAHTTLRECCMIIKDEENLQDDFTRNTNVKFESTFQLSIGAFCAQHWSMVSPWTLRQGQWNKLPSEY